VLTFFGISLPIVQVAGGFILANTGWSLLSQESVPKASGAGSGGGHDALEQAFYPLTLPLTVGPGCISVTIAFGAHIRQQSNLAHIDNLAPFLGALGGMALVCITLALCYQHAGRLASFLGTSGTNIVVRLSAFLLLAMGVQIAWNGFASLLAPLLKGTA
jgi:multiple antibiotic resistance protein